ncbi:ribonuclease H-like domain-containing protein [Colletotrichum acutatum]|uniref:Ribonuclease H-like domain-containing protein n=1 Tax=Glomerella acutata TaxID=27357 RepID=A0AAD8XCB3_GLOAC|nr:ribonuclease H-like domain-containing protein [Colletotrichum acutatum]KAK1721236.1 ribonuclease H-like domain-containing protein [Colletotrichum acutatum]
MPPYQKEKKHQCAICKERFSTKLGQREHRRAKHLDEVSIQPTGAAGLVHPLPVVTQPARAAEPIRPRPLVAHLPIRVKRPESPELLVTQPARAAKPTTPMHTIYRGNMYSPAVGRNAVWNQISNLCHPEERLRREGYTLPTTKINGTRGSSSMASTIDPPCPNKIKSKPKYAALVIDCEMGGTEGGENELIQITILDFLTGNVLLSRRLVNPTRPILDWRENVTGLNATKMSAALLRNEALNGWEAARAELWRYSDKDTILIGQSVHNDLRVLHTSHARIIDSAIITADAVLGAESKITKRWGLEALCKELLGIQIRSPIWAADGVAHDNLEDCLATRELVLYCAQNTDQLKRWAQRTRISFLKMKTKKNKKNKGSKPRAVNASSGGPSRQIAFVRSAASEDEWEDEDESPLRWEDVVDWDTWPKSPPDSD